MFRRLKIRIIHKALYFVLKNTLKIMIRVSWRSDTVERIEMNFVYPREVGENMTSQFAFLAKKYEDILGMDTTYVFHNQSGIKKHEVVQ